MSYIIACLAVALVSATGLLQEAQEWRIAGGVLLGCLFGGFGGMLMALMGKKRLPLEVYAFRFAMNFSVGFVLGCLAMWALSVYYDIVPGLLLSIGGGGVCSLFGVAIAKALEPALIRRLRGHITGPARYRRPPPTVHLVSPPTDRE